MKFNKKLQQIWHDWFYKNASQERMDFALRCRDVCFSIDLHKNPQNQYGYIRFWLHLSLCRACKHYYDFSKALRRAVKKRPIESAIKTPINMQKLNADLVKKHSAANKSNSPQ